MLQQKKTEEAHIARLTEEWKQKLKKLENKLNDNVNKCRLLALTLNETTDELRKKTYKQAEAEKEVYLYFCLTYSLLIYKDGRACQNISIQFPCVFMCLSYIDLFNFW